MNCTKKNLITCYIGLTVVHHEVLRHANTQKNLLEKLHGQVSKPLSEVHITIVPPFHVDYITASAINLGCALSTLQSTSLINTTVFCIQKLESMVFEGEEIFYFPVTTLKKTSCDEIGVFEKRVLEFQKQIQGLGGTVRLPVPKGYSPHISIFKRNSEETLISKEDTLKESDGVAPLFFRATYPTLYAKYKGYGYKDLREDPNNY